MTLTPLSIWCAVLTIVVVTVAVITDLLWRRIPNFLTLPAFCAAVIVRATFQDWAGLALALAGGVAAPMLLLVIHGGKGIGMGDLKLAAALGAALGPAMAVVSVFLSAVAGGVIAMVVMFKPGGQLREIAEVLLIGLPFVKKDRDAPALDAGRQASETIPYGLAIGAGFLAALAVYLWTGNENWFLAFVGIAANGS